MKVPSPSFIPIFSKDLIPVLLFSSFSFVFRFGTRHFQAPIYGTMIIDVYAMVATPKLAYAPKNENRSLGQGMSSFLI